MMPLALTACGEATAPPGTVQVTVTADGTPAPKFIDKPNGPLIQCTYPFTATATGRGTTTWAGAQTLWYIGADRATPVDTTSNAASEVQSAFGAATISGGETRHAVWSLYAGVPFEASVGFQYGPSGGQTSLTSTRVTCGLTSEAQVVPSVDQVVVFTKSGDLQIADTLYVAYNETGASGVWMSVVDVSGAFRSEQVRGEHLQASVSDTAKFYVPFAVMPGVPMTASVRVYNATLASVSKSVPSQVEFVDRIPPTMDAVSTSQHTGVAGQFAVGDTMDLSVGAIDDNAVGWLVYQIGPPANVHDSVSAQPPTPVMSWDVKLIVRPEWVGTPPMSVYVRDLGGLTSQTATSAPDSIRFYPIVNRPSTSPLVLSTQYAINDVVYDAKRDLAYVSLPGNQILVFSPSTMALQTPIALPAAANAMDLSLSGDSLLVALPALREIGVVDLTNPTQPLGTIRLSALDTVPPNPNSDLPVGPSGLRIASNGKIIVTLSRSMAHNVQTVEVDLKTGAQRVRADASSWTNDEVSWSQVMDRTPDRSRIYLLSGYCSSRYDAASDSFSPCSAGLYTDFFGMSFDATGSLIGRGPYLLDADMHTVWQPGTVNAHSPHLAPSPDGSTVYLGAGQSLTTARYADKVMLERTPIPVNADRMLVSPNGQWALVFESYSSSRVTRVDLR